MNQTLSDRRNLRTGTPLWLSRGLLKLRIPKTLPKTLVDVVVVGTGISGALVADAMLNAGFSVLAVDRRKPMAGSTPASTALLQSELDMPLVALQRKIGVSNAGRVWLRLRVARAIHVVVKVVVLVLVQRKIVGELRVFSSTQYPTTWPPSSA